MSQEDLTNLLQWFNVEKNDFIENYCRFVPFYDGSDVLALKEMPNYACIFLVKEGDKAYMASPTTCSTYPFVTFIQNAHASWAAE